MVADQYDFQADLRMWAQAYAAGDWPVFPLHSPQHSPRQSCDCPKGNECGDRSAKHPRTAHGLKDGSTDDATIERWWRMWPRANIGIAVPSGFVVLDIDGPDGLEAIAAEGWRIPPTVTAATSRGWHHWFRANVEIRPGSDFLPHVDMRGPGGYVVAPPSLHFTGVQYAWETSPLDAEAVPAPDWIYELVNRSRSRPRTALPGADVPIIEGGRNETLTRIAGAMRRHGCSERAILAALEVTNTERCSPPLDEPELSTIAWSVAHYPPAAGPVSPLWEREPW